MAGDALWSDVTLLAPMDSDFADTSTGGATPALASSPTIEASGKFGSYGNFDAADRVVYSGVSFRAGDWTVEAWINRTASSFGSNSGAVVIEIPGVVMLGRSGLTSLALHEDDFGDWSSVAPAYTFADQEWHHIALVRDGGTIRLYADGSQVSTMSFAGSNGSSLQLGESSASFGGVFGVDDLRVTASARYPGGTTFTPPTAAHATGSGGDSEFANVKLLLHLNGDLTDSSSSAVVPTLSNSPGVFGSGQYGQGFAFDGFGGYVTVPASSFAIGTQDFALEMWINTTSLSGTKYLYDLDNYTHYCAVILRGDTIEFYHDGTSNAVSAAITANEWHHVAVSRSSGVIRVFVDGVASAATYNFSESLTHPSHLIGGTNGFDAGTVNGSIDEVRLTVGSDRGFTGATIPVPTAAFPDSAGSSGDVSAIYLGSTEVTAAYLGGTEVYSAGGASDPDFASVSLLLHMDGSNGSTTFTDSSSNAFTGTRYGSLAVSTTESKFGGASAAFSGGTSADALDFADNAAFDFGTGDFTLECWAYLNGTPGNVNALVAKWGSAGNEWIWWVNNSGKLVFYTNGGSVTSSASVPTGQWTFLSVTRQSGTVKVFIGGAQGASSTISTDFNGSATLSVGNYPAFGNFNHNYGIAVDGYLDDVRITKGVARYTAAFTPPTEPFPDQ